MNESQNNYPFADIFRLRKKEVPVYKIAKEVGVSAPVVTKIIKGHHTIPRNQVAEIEAAGIKICSNCRKRIVPFELFDYVQLSTLCLICWRLGEGEREHKVHLSDS